MKKYHVLRLDGLQLRLRLTVAGQRALRERFGTDTLQVILESALDAERMAALLDAALNWTGNDNELCSGEALYDRLVDEGWSGQETFGALALDIAAASGLLRPAQAQQLKASMAQAVDAAFQSLEDVQSADSGESPEGAEDPFGTAGTRRS